MSLFQHSVSYDELDGQETVSDCLSAGLSKTMAKAMILKSMERVLLASIYNYDTLALHLSDTYIYIIL